MSCIQLILIIGVCGMGEFNVVTAVVCAGTTALGVVTNLTGLGGVLNGDVPGTSGPGALVEIAPTPHPVFVTEVCPVTPPCISLGAALALLYPVLYNFPLSYAEV